MTGWPNKRWEPEFKELENGIRITVTQPEDPAYMLLMDPNCYSTPVEGIYRSDCYICRDPEFAQMGLPLCYPCEACGGHVPADDSVCSDCGVDAQELAQEKAVAKCAEEGHIWKDHEEQVFFDTTHPAYTSCDRCGARPDA